jgi:imidazolonepropionase-like amidohydrolase
MVIRGARLFDGTALRRGRGVGVLVGDGRISDVDLSGAAPPDGAQVVELGDVTLLPGLVDAHQHLCFDPAGDVVEQMRHDSDSVLLQRMHDHAQAALRAGITTIRDLGDRRYLGLTLRERYTADPTAGPEVLLAGPPITPTRGHCWFLGGEADGLDALLRAVSERAARGVDVIKIMATGGMLTPGRALHESQYPRHELAAVTDAAHRAGLPITAHAHGPCGIADAVAVGVDGVEHCSFVGSTGVEPDWSTVAALAEAGTSVGATEAWLPHGPPIPAGELIEQGWANVARMHREGVRIVCCSDAGIGPRKPHDVLPHGVALLASLGISTADALATVTSVAADACGLTGRKGRLLPGHDADVLAVAGDPTARPSALLDVRAVFRAGRRVV